MNSDPTDFLDYHLTNLMGWNELDLAQTIGALLDISNNYSQDCAKSFLIQMLKLSSSKTSKILLVEWVRILISINTDE
jgi:hypothetical protein